MRAFLYVGLAGAAVALGVILLRMSGCPALFPRPGAQLASGQWVDSDNIKTPLNARVRVRKAGRLLRMQFELTDADGERIRTLRTSKGQPAAPTVRVFDASGQVLHSGQMSYG